MKIESCLLVIGLATCAQAVVPLPPAHDTPSHPFSPAQVRQPPTFARRSGAHLKGTSRNRLHIIRSERHVHLYLGHNRRHLKSRSTRLYPHHHTSPLTPLIEYTRRTVSLAMGRVQSFWTSLRLFKTRTEHH
ncbi:hypothetical protein H4R33_003266 [Dimargaris cristalligena]|uniref:Uncharacterized protein n=1 Tax=Dimargaris cristalligena TaxID=215637 RepID=A0A4Q0A2P2_9FUNG|nr:hypothetical protein H4R33_003266 [Dimargaris cristalligena]RKP40406.1 hypothetical protein BJ085DRAFT_36956 [Dimargaris cristalligena]|eukprot:RKP40406.1 hypothetical protein BJ085DRAFT_36956 [Dimargaris cristalligena]